MSHLAKQNQPILASFVFVEKHATHMRVCWCLLAHLSVVELTNSELGDIVLFYENERDDVVDGVKSKATAF